MGILSYFVLLPALIDSLRPRASNGCTRHESHAHGLVENHIQVADFEPVWRSYWVVAPPDPDQPAPLLIAIHGQTGDAISFAESHNFTSLGKPNNLMAVFPQGMNDSYPGEDQGTGWNVGSAADNATCLLEGVGGNYGCYRSCRKLKKCGRCNWSTCYDDVLYIRAVIKAVSEKFCIDLDRVYAQGESNGAMMVHHLVRNMPDTFAGVATWFGTPMLGYMLGGSLQFMDSGPQLSRTAILAMHGRQDTTIPPGGGVSDEGWIFETFEQSTGIWAATHQCSRPSVPIQTKWDGGDLNFRCTEYTRCSTGRRVLQCMYDGVHGDWPTGNDGSYCGDQITLWFLLQYSRGLPVASAEDAIEFNV